MPFADGRVCYVPSEGSRYGMNFKSLSRLNDGSDVKGKLQMGTGGFNEISISSQRMVGIYTNSVL